MAYFIISGLLILLCISGLVGLFLFQEYTKKISSLSIAYSSFLILAVMLSLKSSNLNQTLSIMTTILVVFSINLFVGMGIIKNIAEVDKN